MDHYDGFQPNPLDLFEVIRTKCSSKRCSTVLCIRVSLERFLLPMLNLYAAWKS